MGRPDGAGAIVAGISLRPGAEPSGEGIGELQERGFGPVDGAAISEIVDLQLGTAADGAFALVQPTIEFSGAAQSQRVQRLAQLHQGAIVPLQELTVEAVGGTDGVASQGFELLKDLANQIIEGEHPIGQGHEGRPAMGRADGSEGSDLVRHTGLRDHPPRIETASAMRDEVGAGAWWAVNKGAIDGTLQGRPADFDALHAGE